MLAPLAKDISLDRRPANVPRRFHWLAFLIASSAAALVLGPPLAAVVGIEAPEWASLLVVALGITLVYNWANYYKAQRFARGAIVAYFVAFALATGNWRSGLVTALASC